MAFDWTDEAVADLRLRWDRGETCSEIGAAIGATRNAVIGKVTRLGLPGRKASTRAALSAAEVKAKLKARNDAHTVAQRARRLSARLDISAGERAAPREIVVQPVNHEPLNIPFGDLRPLSRERSNQCRFIAAEPAGPDYLACGLETPPGESWCAHCTKIVHYRPPELTEQDRARRAMQGRKIVRPATINKNFEVTDEAA
jgi:GcrA cell cycle regulator